jgi:uncharacterized protein (TIGR04222 family)
MTPTGDTWGISGPLFLMAFFVLAVAVTVAVVRVRRAVADVPAVQPLGRLDGRPYDVAYLNGGPHLAVCAALSAMHRSGTVATAGRGTVLAAGRPEPRTDELERAVHHAAATAVPRRNLADVGAVASALHRIESRLLAAGLLLSPQQQDRIRRPAGWTFALAVFGGVRIIAGYADGRPVGFLVPMVFVMVVLSVVLAVRVPRRSRAGDAALRRLVADHHALSPAMRPDWEVYGPSGAALAVGVFGLGALWASDPVFAGELAVQRATTMSGFGGTSSGDSGSSSCSSGSSCGGGGGCGGGGCGG